MSHTYRFTYSSEGPDGTVLGELEIEAVYEINGGTKDHYSKLQGWTPGDPVEIDIFELREEQWNAEKKAYEYVEMSPHHHLWDFLVEYALDTFPVEMQEEARS